MANYIKRLEAENKLKAVEICGLRSSIQDLMTYLHSPKFHNDSTVQVSDIIHRLQEGENRTQDLIVDQFNINDL